VPKSVQNVGPQCQRSEVNNSEDNSAYKAFFHSCVRCPGAGECANPLIYQPLLYPRIDNIDRYLSDIAQDRTKHRHAVRFTPAWKARRWEMSILAQRAQEKHDRARRIGVIHDTTLFKGVDDSTLSDDAKRRFQKMSPRVSLKMMQTLIQQAIRLSTGGGSYLEPIIELTMQHLAVPLPWHPDQPHIAEWQACSAREILLHLDESVDARNVAQKQAAKHKSSIVGDPNAEHDDDRGPRMYIEDLGGAPADMENDEEEPEEGRSSKQPLRISAAHVEKVLTRSAEREAVKRQGRHKDMHTEMARVAEIFGDNIDEVMMSFHVAVCN